MKPAHNLIIIAAIIGIIAAVSGSLLYVFNKTSPQTNETQRVTQSNQEITQKPSDEEGKVLSGGGDPCAKITIKDNNFSPNSVTAVYDNSKSQWCALFILNYDSETGYGPTRTLIADYTNWSKTLCGTTGCQVTAVRYYSTSGTYIYHLQSNTSAKATIYAGTSSPPSDSTTTTATTTTTTVQEETITDVALPSVFSAKGSKTTNLSKLSDTAKVKKLTFDVVGKNRIVFTDTVNLSSDKARDLFKKLDKYVKMSKVGVVEVNSKTLSMLAKKKATVFMFKLPFLDTPDILVNGKADTKKIVSNIKYDKDKGTLTFSVKNFSKFEAVPKLEIIEPKNGFIAEQESITLRGKIGDLEASVSAQLNGQSLGNIKVATKSGEFSKDLNLKKGRNNIVVNAISSLGPPLEATVSGIFLPPIETKGYTLGTTQMIGIGILILLLLTIVGAWWYYKKRKINPDSPPPK